MWLARTASVTVVVLACIRLAWVGDDALITLRTALNLTHGWGPGFNATESVQGYTHPLWFLLWMAIGSGTGQWILGILAVSIALTGAAVALIAIQVVTVARLVVVTALLVLSNAFIEYSTSGLENPLAYATVGLLVVLTLGSPRAARLPAVARGALLGLVAAACVLTRLDLALIIAPAVAVVLWSNRRNLRLLVSFLAGLLVPALVWFAWSYTSYRVLLPNTFSAKRNLDIPTAELVVQGLRYLWVTFETDPVTMVALAAGVGGAIAFGTVVTRAWAGGLILYVAYIVWIGGDFMVGRFLAVPVYVAVFLLAVTHRPGSSKVARSALESGTTLLAIAAVALLLIGCSSAARTPVALTASHQPRWTVDWNTMGGIADERAFWGADRSLGNIVFNLALAYTQPDFVGPSTGASLTRSLREIDKAAKNWPSTDTAVGKPDDVAVLCGGLGQAGIASGPRVHLVDDCALTDRFLADRPATARDFQWRIGDFHRPIPDGYVDALHADNPGLLKNPEDAVALARLWAQIRPND